MYSRNLQQTLNRFLKFPIIAVLGPRQSGKSTIVRMSFPQHRYISFDKSTDLAFAQDDPERFLQVYDNEVGIILDEFHKAPNLASYIKYTVDQKRRSGYFILTSSENFLSKDTISESFAGRVGLLTLLPLSLNELSKNGLLDSDRSVDMQILQGGYPRIYADAIDPVDFYPSYIQTYIERDIKGQINEENLRIFRNFVQLCAGRTGQTLVIESLSSELGLSAATVRKWLSYLEASYIIFFLPPYAKSFDKRISKKPKLYFYDTGLACSLLNIFSIDALALSPFRGALFETLIISDFYKQFYNHGFPLSLYYWKLATAAYEVDCLVDLHTDQVPIEIKSAVTIAPHFFKGLNYWHQLSYSIQSEGFVVYAGDEEQKRTLGTIIGWKESGNLMNRLVKFPQPTT